MAAALALWGEAAASALPSEEPVHTYRMVTTRGINPGQLRIWEVDTLGNLEEIDFVPIANVEFEAEMRVDPFGRYLIHGNLDQTTVDVYGVSPAGEITLAHQASREGWRLSNRFHTLADDGQLFVLVTQELAGEFPFFYETFQVTDELELLSVGTPLRVGPSDDPDLRSISIVDCITRPGMYPYQILTASRVDGIACLNRVPIDAQGQVTEIDQQFCFIASNFNYITVRPDQRLIAFGSFQDQANGDYEFVNTLSMEDDGWMMPIDTYKRSEMGFTGTIEMRFHPSGNSILAAGGVLLNGGGPSSIPVERDGTFIEPATVGPWPDAGNDFAASPDGRIGVTELFVDGEGIHWGVFALDPYGGFELLQEHVMPFGYHNAAFIPPRTEDILGDANADGRRDIRDVVTYVNHFNDDGTYPEWHPLSPVIRGPVPMARADADQDGDIDEDDLQWIIEFLLTQ